MDLGVTVLASFGGRHLDDLAGATCAHLRVRWIDLLKNLTKRTLDNDMTVLTESRALHREGGRGAGTRLEINHRK